MSKRILIVDDLSANRRILSAMLCKSYDILEAAGGEEALQVLEARHESISAVLLDIGMPGIDGYEVLRRMRSGARFANIPVIMITGSEDEGTRVKSLALGANDFVMKPYVSEVIKHCLKNNIALHEASETVRAMQRDKLTGLFSREAFFDNARAMVSSRAPGYYVMACFDIDKFKVINDQYGTAKGDEVLRHTADAFREGFEPHGGICCRVSADDFAVLYPAAFQDSAEIRAIRASASRVEGIVSPIIFRIGRYLVDDVTMPPAAMYDRAMLAANTIKGRYDTKIAIYDETMRERLLREQGIVMEMEDALKARQFETWFQPQYNHATDAMIGAEALVRWRHPQKGLIAPGVFIPVFEQNGFIYSLDKFVWEEVCRYLRKWIDEGRHPLPVSVNISRYDIFQSDLIESITDLVRRYALPIDMLRLEITESAFSESSEHIVRVVRELVEYGFTVELDDFGSGYSSLNTLKDVPAQILKLDMKFLESSADSQRGGNIVESIVRMAKWLGMSVIAEGVETLKQADYLRSIGCNYMQGYLYARPMEAARYEAHCSAGDKEERLFALETVENLDNNAFWDPESMDTLIFNSFVGGACIYEYYHGNIELIRATEKYAQVIGSAGMTVEDALKLNWAEHLDEENRKRVTRDLDESVATHKEVTGEYVFLDLPGCPHETYLRSTMRVIASAGERYLVYCTNENITAQRRSEKREREVAEEMRLIMDNVDLGIIAVVVKDGRARYVFANDHYYKMLGYTKAQFEAEVATPYQTVAPEDRERIMRETANVNRTEKSAVLVYAAVTRDGRERVFRSAISFSRMAGMEEPVQLSILRDITQETQIERRERQVAEQVQAIMRDVGCGITAVVLDGDGRIDLLFVNDQFFEIHGYTRSQYEAEVTDKYALIHPDDREWARKATIEAYTSRTPARLEYRLVGRDGSVRWVRVSLSSTRFTGVEQNVHLCIFTDITLEKRAEQAIRETSEQLRAMMRDMPGGFVRMRVGGDGKITPVYINEGFMKLVGMSYDGVMELYASDALAGVHPDDVATVNDAVARMFQNGEARSTRYRLRHGSGGYIWLSIFGRVTKDAAGDTFLNVYYTDATEQADEARR